MATQLLGDVRRKALQGFATGDPVLCPLDPTVRQNLVRLLLLLTVIAD